MAAAATAMASTSSTATTVQGIVPSQNMTSAKVTVDLNRNGGDPTTSNLTVDDGLGRPITERGVDAECVNCTDTENEPNCNATATLGINNGCFDTPPAAGWGFSPITIGVEVCGKLSRSDLTGSPAPIQGVVRDCDTYRITVPAGGRRVVLSALAEVPHLLAIARPGSNLATPCTGWALTNVAGSTAVPLTACNGAPNLGSTLTVDLPAGTFEALIFHSGGTAGGTTPCNVNAQYRFRVDFQALPTGACCNLTAGTCVTANAISCGELPGVQQFRGAGTDCANVTCFSLTCTPDGISIFDEAEPACGDPTDNTNPGCSVTPPPTIFIATELDCGRTVCATTRAIGGIQDTDWYEWQGTGSIQDVSITVIAEFPVEAWIFGVPVGGCSGALTGFVGQQGTAGTPLVVNRAAVPAGTPLWFLVRPASAVNAPIFDGFECGHKYSITFNCVSPAPAACCTQLASATPVCIDNLTEAQCVAQNGVYRGLVNEVPSTCATIECCPIDITEATAEAGTSKAPLTEPLCGDAGNDFANGGCNADPGFETFRDVACGDLIWGTSTFDRAVGIRDTDWYILTVTAPQGNYVAALVQAQFDNIVFLNQAGTVTAEDPFGCLTDVTLSGFGADACDLNIAGACATPGTYFIIVVPTFDVAFPCSAGARYLLEIFCCDACTTEVACPGGSGSEPAGEADCDGTDGNGNNGCSLDTPVAANFTPIAAGQTICGTTQLVTDDKTGIISRDPDWYTYNHPGGPLTVELRHEFVADLFIWTPAGANQGCDNAIIEDGFILGCPTTDPDSNDVMPMPDLPAGTYYILVAPSFFQDDFACGAVTSGSDVAQYTLTIASSAPPCNCVRGQGDANGDCNVNGADLSVLLSQFGTNVAPNTGADFNNSGNVDGADLSVLLSNFGCSTP